MTDFLWTLLRLSLAGSLLAGVLFLLKPLLRDRVSRAAAYYLWLLVLLRLCIPAGLTLPLPEFNTPAPAQISNAQQQAAEGQTAPAAPVNSGTPQPTQTNPTPTPSPETARRSNSLPTVLFALWAAGAAGVGGWYVTGYLRVRRTVQRTAVPAEPEALGILAELSPQGRVRLVESGGVNSPLLLGVFRPTIVLPVGVTDPARLRDILSHELTHARRQDLLVKWFAALAASIHWFNPLLPFIRREISRACELACDEAVVKFLEAPARKHYGETLLLLAAEAPVGALPLAVTLCEEKKTLEERLVSIVKIHRRTPAAILLTLALVLVLGGCALFTGAAQAQAPQGLTDPESGITVKLDMTREEVEQLLGPGILQYEGPSYYGGTQRCFFYNTEAGGLRVRYEDETVEMLNAVGEYYFDSASFRETPPFRWTTEAGISQGSAMEDVQREYQRWPVHDLFREGLGSVFSCQGRAAGKDSFWLYITAGEDSRVKEIILQRTYPSAAPPPTSFTNPSTGAEVTLRQTRAEIEAVLGPGENQSNLPWQETDGSSNQSGTMHQRGYEYDTGEAPLAVWSEGISGETEHEDLPDYTEVDSMGQRGYEYGSGEAPQAVWSEGTSGEADHEDLPDYAEAEPFTVYAYGEGADRLFVHYRQDQAVGFSTHYITDPNADPEALLVPFHWQLDGLSYGATPEELQQVYPDGNLSEFNAYGGRNVQVFQYCSGTHFVECGVYDGKLGTLSLSPVVPG